MHFSPEWLVVEHKPARVYQATIFPGFTIPARSLGHYWPVTSSHLHMLALPPSRCPHACHSCPACPHCEGSHSGQWPAREERQLLPHPSESVAGVYTKFSGRLSEEPFIWLMQKFPCILLFKIGQPGCQLNLPEGQIRLDLTSGRPLV